MNKNFAFFRNLLAGVLVLASQSGLANPAADDATLSNEQVAKNLQNPLANMISVPVQLNYDQNIGDDDKGDRYITNIQPVVPINLNEDWLLISRTILPIVSLDTTTTDESGTGDIVQSAFFSPKQSANGWTWGVGPVFLLPTASDDALGQEKWGVGPTAVALKQENGWTYGALINHIWDVAGDDDRSDVNATFLQPFMGYTWPSAFSLFLNTETTIDWENDTEAVPINFVASQVAQVGSQTLSFGGGLRYWADSPDNGPEGWGARFVVTWIIPK